MTHKKESPLSFRPIAGFPEYAVTDTGQIFSFKRSRFRKLGFGYGYHNVLLTRPKEQGGFEQKGFYVHALVASAFIGPRPLGFQINHKNGIKTDNRVENLEYCTPAENAQHALRTGLKVMPAGEKCYISKLSTEKVNRLRSGEFDGQTQTQIAKLFGVHQSSISYALSRRNWKSI